MHSAAMTAAVLMHGARNGTGAGAAREGLCLGARNTSRDSEESMVAPQPEAVTAGNDVYAAEASAVL
jgi:hypothetical protein